MDNDNEKCKRDFCDNDALPMHTCPYREDVNGDYETLCDCCKECQLECTDGI